MATDEGRRITNGLVKEENNVILGGAALMYLPVDKELKVRRYCAMANRGGE